MEKWVAATKKQVKHHIKILDSSNSLFFRSDEESHPLDMAYQFIFQAALLEEIVKMQMQCPYYSNEHCRMKVLPFVRQKAQLLTEDLYFKYKQWDLSNILALLNAKNKKKLDKLESTLVLEMHEFYAFLCLADEQGYTVKRKYFNSTKPEHAPTHDEVAALKAVKGDISESDVLAKKAARKMIAIKNDRKLRTSFLIEKQGEWHIFSFDLVDELYAPPEQNHFNHEHMHYSSHLFGNHADKNLIWKTICEEGRLDAPYIHVRVKEKKRPITTQGPANQLMWFE